MENKYYYTDGLSFSTPQDAYILRIKSSWTEMFAGLNTP